MTEEQIRGIIKEELRPIMAYLEFFNKTNYNFEKHLVILNDKNIQLGKSVGSMIGTETTQKVGFLGKSPATRQSAISDPAGGTTVDTQARATIATLIDVLQAFGFIE